MAGPADVIALQRAIGNRALARLAKSDRQALHRACCSSCATGHTCEDEELDELPHIPRPHVARVLARYAHQDCSEDDLKDHIWPADHIAKRMVKKAIKALSYSPIEAPVAALFPKYFMTSSPKIAKILHVFDQVDAEFRDNDYTYECEDDCEGTEFGHTWSGLTGAITQSHIHVCMNHLRDKANECIARTIVHEFTHRYADTDDNGYCKSGCGYSSCPSDLTEDNALENADSFACFAYEVWPMTLLSYP